MFLLFFPHFSDSFFFKLLLIFHSFFPLLVHPSHSHLVMVIRLQVPRLALRRRLNALSGSVSRPTPWRRRPIAFLCYILSASTLRPLANRVRAAVSWLDSGEEGGAANAWIYYSICVFLLHGFIINTYIQNKYILLQMLFVCHTSCLQNMLVVQDQAQQNSTFTLKFWWCCKSFPAFNWLSLGCDHSCEGPSRVCCLKLLSGIKNDVYIIQI